MVGLRCCTWMPLQGLGGAKSSWINEISGWLMQLPPQQVSQIPCRHPRLGSAQLSCSCISLVQRQQQPAGPCRWAQRDSQLPSPPELRLSSHKAGFYGPPRECEQGCVCAIPGIYNPSGRRSGPAFSNAVSRSLDPLGLRVVLKRVYFGFETHSPGSSAQIDFLSSSASSKLFSWQLLLL